MIIGIGTDLIEITRVEKACKNKHFFMRCFSIKELEFIKDNYSKCAGNWAVKEAVAKAFGTGIVGFDLTDISVLRNQVGAPYVELTGGALDIFQDLGADCIHVSISNTKEYASAYVVIESRGK